MRHLFVVLVCAASFLVAAGCKSDNHNHDSHDQKMSGDACPKCPGVQKMTADGKCPHCGAKVSADACTHCAGVQTATTDGKCPVCSAKKG